jgi:tRNA G18 (ribose-2'-O)-methylase SpoU
MSYFEVGVYNARNQINIGTLWRSAYQLGAAGIFTIGRPYSHQTSDTSHAMQQIPMRHYLTFDDFLVARPVGAALVGIEMGGIPYLNSNILPEPFTCWAAKTMGCQNESCRAVMQLFR